jgi:lambda family phage tail tape measure protein
MQVLILNQDKLGLSSDELARSLRKMRIEFLEGQTDMASGLERGALKTLEEFGDTAKLAEELVTNAFKNLEDVLVEFFQTGQLNFKQFIDSITADLTRLAVRDAITGPLAKLLFGKKDTGEEAAGKIKKGIIDGSKEGAEIFRKAIAGAAGGPVGMVPVF